MSGFSLFSLRLGGRRGPAAEVERPPRVTVLRWFAAICGLGVLAGLLWFVVAPHPTGTWTPAGGVFATPDAPGATLTAWYLGITGIAGLLTGIPIVALADHFTVPRALTIIGAGFAAACLTYAVGFLLGADPIADQVGASTQPVQIELPFVLPSPLLVLLWPAVSALIAVVGLMLSVMLVGEPRPVASPESKVGPQSQLKQTPPSSKE